jgi:hypothetical protein
LELLGIDTMYAVKAGGYNLHIGAVQVAVFQSAIDKLFPLIR